MDKDVLQQKQKQKIVLCLSWLRMQIRASKTTDFIGSSLQETLLVNSNEGHTVVYVPLFYRGPRAPHVLGLYEPNTLCFCTEGCDGRKYASTTTKNCSLPVMVTDASKSTADL